MRIGIGYDIHRLIEDRKLVLAGVEIPYIKGLISHSDGDVVIHALADAILGAMAMGDIGKLFPDTDEKSKGMSSSGILTKVISIMNERKFVLKNVDTAVIAEEPKIYPFKDKMIDSLAAMLGIAKDRINIKATTNEGVGSLGKGEAIAAYAVVLLEERG